MRYAVTIRWNENIVLHGTMTATMLYGLLQKQREEFAGSTFNQLATLLPTLGELHGAEIGKRFSYAWKDETGACGYQAERID